MAVIDDEPAIRRLLRTALEGAGWQVVEASSGQDGLVLVAQRQPDLVLLDLGLPDLEGREVLRRLREWSDVPVIILTVRDDPEEKVAVLDEGADDFVTKPFHTGELLARVRTVGKRVKPTEQTAEVAAGSITFDLRQRQVRRGNRLLDFTPIELRILLALARHPDRIVTKTALQQAVWGPQATSLEEHLRVHLAAIRKKLRAEGCDSLIATETGVGYRLVRPGKG